MVGDQSLQFRKTVKVKNVSKNFVNSFPIISFLGRRDVTTLGRFVTCNIVGRPGRDTAEMSPGDCDES